MTRRLHLRNRLPSQHQAPVHGWLSDEEDATVSPHPATTAAFKQDETRRDLNQGHDFRPLPVNEGWDEPSAAAPISSVNNGHGAGFGSSSGSRPPRSEGFGGDFGASGGARPAARDEFGPSAGAAGGFGPSSSRDDFGGSRGGRNDGFGDAPSGGDFGASRGRNEGFGAPSGGDYGPFGGASRGSGDFGPTSSRDDFGGPRTGRNEGGEDQDRPDRPPLEAVPSKAYAPRSDKFTEDRDAALETQLFEELKLESGINFEKYDKIPVKTSGSQVPPPATTFEQMQLHPHMYLNLKLAKYAKPTPIQKHAIPIINGTFSSEFSIL